MESYRSTRYNRKRILVSLILFIFILSSSLLYLFISSKVKSINSSKTIEVLSPMSSRKVLTSNSIGDNSNDFTIASNTSKNITPKDIDKKPINELSFEELSDLNNEQVENDNESNISDSNTSDKDSLNPDTTETSSNESQDITSPSTSSTSPNNSAVTDPTKASERIIDPNKPMVALTFDDGPSPKSSTRILNALEKNNSVATFFELGSLVSKYPEIVKREEALGCEIGSHTYSHKNLNKLSKKQIKSEIKKSKKAFTKALGHDVKLIRPPYGNANAKVRSAIKYPLVNWSVDTLDWKSKKASSIIKEVKKVKNLDGKIILMHSTYNSTAKAVEYLIPYLKKQGYQLVTVSEMVKYKQGKSLKAGTIYYGDF